MNSKEGVFSIPISVMLPILINFSFPYAMHCFHDGMLPLFAISIGAQEALVLVCSDV